MALVPAGFAYFGCVELNELSFFDITSQNPNSPVTCAAICASNGLDFAAVSDNFCGCANELPEIIVQVEESACYYDCNDPANPGAKCGGLDLASFTPLYSLFVPGNGENPGVSPPVVSVSVSVSESESVSVSVPVPLPSSSTDVVVPTSEASTTSTTSTAIISTPIVSNDVTLTLPTSTEPSTITIAPLPTDIVPSVPGPDPITSSTSTCDSEDRNSVSTSSTTEDEFATTILAPIPGDGETPIITRTVYSTYMVTITSCAATVTKCAQGIVVTGSSFVRTECYPASAIISTAPVVVSSTVTSCDPDDADCSVGVIQTSTTMGTTQIWVDPQPSTDVLVPGQVIVTRLVNGTPVVETARVLGTGEPITPENIPDEKEEEENYFLTPLVESTYSPPSPPAASPTPPTTSAGTATRASVTPPVSGTVGVNTVTFASLPVPTLITSTTAGVSDGSNNGTTARPTIPIVPAAASSFRGLSSVFVQILAGLSVTFGVMVLL